MTHDFEDAAALADRVGVIVEGRILQIGTPAELVAAPADPFVASFTGANLLPGQRAPAAATASPRCASTRGVTAWSTDPGEGRVALAIYPWEVSIARRLRPTPR